MSEPETELVVQETRSIYALKTLFDSFIILFRNQKLFSIIFTLTILPLSLLLFTLAIYAHPLETQIYHLEALALFSPTRFEAGHIQKESRLNSVTLLQLKALFFLPSYILSLLAMITAVNSTALAYSGRRPNCETASTAVRKTWKRPLVTSIYVFVIMLAYVHLPRTLSAVVGARHVRWLVVVLGAFFEVYLMAVLGLGMVVSVLEERFGWEAVRVGWGLMEGRRFWGWVLAGFLVVGSGGVGWRFRVLMEGQDLVVGTMTGFVDKLGLICLFGLVVLWSYVVNTVFYCECRKRHVSRGDNRIMV